MSTSRMFPMSVQANQVIFRGKGALNVADRKALEAQS